ncbi:MAG TPA: CxxC-x17-CxxC domain-containing protein [Candidatus Nanoarchaeia archaeon]|nr:CxxC-x17-CxxC domain-containing protein [Candidatus Nanoarchaeia archaeon]
MPKTYAVICSECGEWCDVKFKPKPDSPVCCKDCYKEKKGY